MSSCLIIQECDDVFIGSDTAVSITYKDVIYRLNTNGKKLYVVEDMVIFCSGNLNLSYSLMDNFIKGKDHSVEKLRDMNKEYCLKFDSKEIDILICSMLNNKTIVYQISPYEDFKIIIKRAEVGNISTWVGGVKSQECSDSACESLENQMKVEEVYQKAFDDISYEGVGGRAIVYRINKNGIKLYYTNDIKEKNIRFINEILSNQHLIVADTLIGHLVATNKLVVSDEAGTVTIDGEGININASRTDGKVAIKVNTTDVLKISNLIKDIFSIDATGNVVANDGTYNNIKANNVTAINGTYTNINTINMIATLMRTSNSSNYMIFHDQYIEFYHLGSLRMRVGFNSANNMPSILLYGEDGNEEVGSITAGSSAASLSGNWTVESGSEFDIYGNTNLATKAYVDQQISSHQYIPPSA
ncbi:hypothetical protein [Clostridium estertheticum]|uniref:hypothetical protein n=1 Tax=Clostridium estertheticum TaxID=238834 RepID=UPI001CF4EFDE|nr:hypothetical protein [Clostridium estertheticum]MCB2354469.1 hypothetical protein [Clostridium estertheticum]WAG42418.1 hypothetical protein LL065_07000 [Clostridium estertheticum]